MFSSEHKTRVRYSETDQMGYVYYGNYAQYFELGRVETFRKLGFSYKELEDMGILMPVLYMECQYVKPARYDDEISIITTIPEMPSVRIKFKYEIVNDAGETLTLGSTSLVFIDKNKNRPMKAPEWLLEKLEPFFKS